MTVRTFTLHGVSELTPGPAWQELFTLTWPSYRAWYLREGSAARPSLAAAEARLSRHLPELVPTYERLRELTAAGPHAEDEELAARMLTMWDMPAFLPGCTQVVDTRAEPVLIRNYDYSPDLFEWVSRTTAFTGRRVMGTSDCLWGLVDGMNEDGLAISLTFGGRPGSAPGFGIPLVLRYLLEVCDRVEDAVQCLRGLPVSMAYNLTMTDRHGRVATVFVAPGEEPEVSDLPAVANHRGLTPEYPAHAARFRSVERQQHVLAGLRETPDAAAVADGFLRPPLHSDSYSAGFGTLYTAVYSPEDGTLEYRWPGKSLLRTFDSGYDNATVELREFCGRIEDNTSPQQRGVVMPETPRPPSDVDLSTLSTAQLAAVVREGLSGLAGRTDQEAFMALVELQTHAGLCLGEAARGLATAGSWAQVGDLAGTSKQAAWQRWRET